MSTSEIEAEQPVRQGKILSSAKIPVGWVSLILAVIMSGYFLDLSQDYLNTFMLFGIPAAVAGVALWILLFGDFAKQIRVLAGLLPLLLMGLFLLLIKIHLNGDMKIVTWNWRWQSSADQTLERAAGSGTIDSWESTEHDYPRFLGNGHWAEVQGVQLETDWQTNPPRKLWSKKIGAGWSAFAIVGGYAVTQEQRGENELVTCYEVTTGELVWKHADNVRWDPGGAGSFGYAGPRATPTIYQAKVYSHGATGMLNCLDAKTGELIWSHDTLKENKIESVIWGKAGSPLIVARPDSSALVVVSVGASDGRSLIAYDCETGDEVWAGGDYRSSYASPVLAELLGEQQIISLNETFVTSHRVSDGTVLWKHPWPGNSDSDASVSQPVPVARDQVFLSKGYGEGAELLQLSHGGESSIQVERVWKKRVMKTKMSNVVVRDDYIYGLDAAVMQCIALKSGKKVWKKRRRPVDIGHGQIMLIGDVILALSESGEVVLLEANPKKFQELASMRVFDEKQITWNNPAFSSPYLLVRNAEQAACYQLPVKAAAEVEVAQKN